MPFIFLHLGCLAVFWVGVSPVAVWAAVVLYLIRMFAITGFYHRYFSHKTFKTSRFTQFLFAVIGNSSMQRGPLWWAATHRHHHKHSDHEEDIHSPVISGFLWSHIGWLTSMKNFPTAYKSIPGSEQISRAGFPQPLRPDGAVRLWLADAGHRLGVGNVFPVARSAQSGSSSSGHSSSAPRSCCTARLFINSLAHVWGKRRYETDDDSRNSWLLTFITLGEGWHNNHHRYPHSVRQGFRWWEMDLTYYGLKCPRHGPD